MSFVFSATYWRRKLLTRGESGVAMMGITLAATFCICFAANSWLTEQEHRRIATEQQLIQLKAMGPMFAQTSAQFISHGDLIGLRKLAASTASTLDLNTCTVSIGTNKIIADANPSRVNQIALPERWITDFSADPSATAIGGTSLRFPFSIPDKGAGVVELALSTRNQPILTSAAPSALICAIGLCTLVFVYRRSRGGLAEMEIVRSSLSAMRNGETSLAALQVDGRLGVIAATWNNLLSDFDELRKRTTASSVTAASGNRRGSGNNLEAACDAMSQGLILIDDKMRVRFSNGAACSFLKHDRASLAGIAAADLVKDENFHDAIVAIAEGKQRRAVTLEVELTSETGNGVLRFCIRPVRRGDADSAMIIIEDITQQRTAERARNSFINQVTHELRSPLTNIRLYAETAIEDGEANPEVRANCLNVINKESRRLERIVSEMLSVAEMEAGCSTIHTDEVYFDALIKELNIDYQAQADEKHIKLEFNLSPKLPKILADKDKLGLAVHNLVGNALKYTPEGGKVTVNVDVRENQLAIDVADTGIGIKPEDAEKIFDRFFRSSDPRVGKIVGTGLGLTLAREVMRLHGGDVTVQSEINRGSTFTATLPVSMAA